MNSDSKILQGGATKRSSSSIKCRKEMQNLRKIEQRFLGKTFRSTKLHFAKQSRDLLNARRHLADCMKRHASLSGGKSRRNWVSKAVSKSKHTGEFSLKAAKNGLTSQQYACKVLQSPSKHDLRTRRQAQFYKNINRSHDRC